MTAEIALLNRSALALAADSAVTLRIGSTYKTYNTAEKIFEYSCRQAIALMIYNTAEFLGVPFDVLIRKHREECVDIHLTMKDAADHFLKYLANFDRREGEDKKYFAGILIDSYDQILKELRRINNKRLREGKSKKAPSLAEELIRLLDIAILAAEKSPLPGFAMGKTQEDFSKEYGEVCKQAFLTVLPLETTYGTDDIKTRAERLAFALLKTSTPSEICTGLVFGGFAEKDLFPTLHYLEIDGIYFDEMKILFREEVDIDRAGDRAQIVPFAQKDMADRFIYGMDDEFKADITNYALELFQTVVKSKESVFSAKEQRDIKKLIRTSFASTLEEMCGAERDSILDIVHFMSKKELAEMASALVEVTSAKRRFSIQQETVGGAIDVAVVSRNEGFVWIRRKHYFESEANPGYFARVFPRKGGKSSASAKGGPAGA